MSVVTVTITNCKHVHLLLFIFIRVYIKALWCFSNISMNQIVILITFQWVIHGIPSQRFNSKISNDSFISRTFCEILAWFVDLWASDCLWSWLFDDETFVGPHQVLPWIQSKLALHQLWAYNFFDELFDTKCSLAIFEYDTFAYRMNSKFHRLFYSIREKWLWITYVRAAQGLRSLKT